MISFNRFQVFSVFLFCIISFVFVGISAANVTLNDKFIEAAENGNISQVEALLKQGADMNAGWFDAAALLEASENGHIEVVKYLVENGADLNTGGGCRCIDRGFRKRTYRGSKVSSRQ